MYHKVGGYFCFRFERVLRSIITKPSDSSLACTIWSISMFDEFVYCAIRLFQSICSFVVGPFRPTVSRTFVTKVLDVFRDSLPLYRYSSVFCIEKLEWPVALWQKFKSNNIVLLRFLALLIHRVTINKDFHSLFDCRYRRNYLIHVPVLGGLHLSIVGSRSI